MDDVNMVIWASFLEPYFQDEKVLWNWLCQQVKMSMCMSLGQCVSWPVISFSQKQLIG